MRALDRRIANCYFLGFSVCLVNFFSFCCHCVTQTLMTGDAHFGSQNMLLVRDFASTPAPLTTNKNNNHVFWLQCINSEARLSPYKIVCCLHFTVAIMVFYYSCMRIGGGRIRCLLLFVFVAVANSNEIEIMSS